MSEVKTMNINIGDRVQHRAWYWYAEVAEIPSPAFWTSIIGVRIDGETIVRHIPAFSLIWNTDYFIYDWSDVDEGVQRESTGSS